LVVNLRESADSLSGARHTLEPAALLTKTCALVEAACAAVQHIHETTQGRAAPSLAQAEAFALRELAAARRHQDLAAKSGATCRAACELAVRSVTRALDTLLAELIPYSLAPSA
jgi:hypothetical protein